MKWIRVVQTSDGKQHENAVKAEHYAEERYGKALTQLATKLVKVEKYTVMIEFIEEYLPEFVELAKLAEDRKMEPSEEED
jgi:F0F1-type ATP synthase delta subunit